MAFHLDILSFCTTVFTRFRYLESTRLLALLQGFDENIIAIDNRLMCRRLPSFSYSIYAVKDFQNSGSLEVLGRDQGVELKLRTCLRPQFLLANGSDTLAVGLGKTAVRQGCNEHLVGFSQMGCRSGNAVGN